MVLKTMSRPSPKIFTFRSFFHQKLIVGVNLLTIKIYIRQIREILI